MAPDQATCQSWWSLRERSSRARTGGRGWRRERVDSKVWIRGRGSDTKQSSIPPTSLTSNSIGFKFTLAEREKTKGIPERKKKKSSESAQRHLRNLARCLSRSLLQLRGRLLRYPSSVSILRTVSNGVHSILVVFFSGCWAVVTGQVGWSNVISDSFRVCLLKFWRIFLKF